jgi:hypothetical protein
MKHIVGLLLFAVGSVVVVTAQTAGPSVERAISIQSNIKQQYRELIQTMHQVATELEKTDPTAAAAIAGAALRAEEALIADDMDKVVALLRNGLVVPADVTQARVVAKLREVLQTLRGGGNDLEARLVQLEQMARLMELLKQLILQQRDLESQSRAIAFGADAVKEINAVQQQVGALIARQQEIGAATQTLALDAGGQKLADAAQSLAGLRKRQDALLASLADPFPTPDKMAENIANVRSLIAAAIAARVAVKTVLNDPAVAGPISTAGIGPDAVGIEASIGKMIEEMTKSAKALEADDLKEGQVGAAEARAHIADALHATTKVMGRLPGSQGVTDAVTRQAQMIGKVDTLSPVVDQLAPVAEKKVEATTKPTWESFYGDQPAKPVAYQRVAAGPEGGQTPDGRQIAGIVDALRRLEKTAVITEQARTLQNLQQWSERLSQAVRNVEAVRKDPQFPRQQEQQQKISVNLSLMANGLVPGAPASPQSGPPSWLAGDLQVQMAGAGEKAGAAAGFLAKSDAARANPLQKEILLMLQETINSLQSVFNAHLEYAKEELKAAWQAALERVVLAQKRISLDTLSTWKKRAADGAYRRPEQLVLIALGNDEGRLLTDLELMKQLMDKASNGHTVMVFPPAVPLILGLVRRDLPVVKDRLLAHDAGEETQRIQKLIEQRLEGMLLALSASDGRVAPPPNWGQNKMGESADKNADRVAEVKMNILLQSQINQRTTELETLRAAGKGDAGKIAAECKELAALQGKIHQMVQRQVDLSAAAAQRRLP